MKSLNHRHIAALLLAAVITLGMNSCSSSDDLNEATTKNSIPVNGISFGEDAALSRAAIQADTVRQNLGNGMYMEAVVTPDKVTATQTRTANVVTSLNNVLVCVYVNGSLYKQITTSVSGGQITDLELPTGKTFNLEFYAHADGSALPSVDSDGTITDTGTDLMHGEITDVILENDGTDLFGTLAAGFTFKHVYARACVSLTNTQATVTAATTASINSGAAATSAVVNMSNGSISSVTGTPESDLSDSFSTVGTNTVTSGYSYFIANPSASSITISLPSFTTNGVTFTNKSLTMNNKHFSNGSSYNVKVNLKLGTFSADVLAYTWDKGKTNAKTFTITSLKGDGTTPVSWSVDSNSSTSWATTVVSDNTITVTPNSVNFNADRDGIITLKNANGLSCAIFLDQPNSKPQFVYTIQKTSSDTPLASLLALGSNQGFTQNSIINIKSDVDDTTWAAWMTYKGVTSATTQVILNVSFYDASNNRELGPHFINISKTTSPNISFTIADIQNSLEYQLVKTGSLTYTSGSTYKMSFIVDSSTPAYIPSNGLGTAGTSSDMLWFTY
jgi:hypothetical protein